jgi:hypothetical protein
MSLPTKLDDGAYPAPYARGSSQGQPQGHVPTFLDVHILKPVYLGTRALCPRENGKCVKVFGNCPDMVYLR